MDTLEHHRNALDGLDSERRPLIDAVLDALEPEYARAERRSKIHDAVLNVIDEELHARVLRPFATDHHTDYAMISRLFDALDS